MENAGLLPWFTATAFLHSAMVQERRGMLKVWNVTLVILTFFLTIFGTFMTRSGVVQSVHAFGEDRALAWMFTVFMVILLTFSFGLVIYRLPLLQSRHELDSWASREAAFLANNWVLLFSAFFVLFATMFPTLSEMVMGERLTVGPPFFNKWMLPVGLILLVLTGIGPLMAWSKSTLSNLRYQFLWPVLAGVLTFAALWLAGARVLSSGVCFALCAFVVATIGQEFWRGARVRQGATGSDVLTAMIGLVARSHRRYGGYIVHLGIILMFVGFAGEGYKREEQRLLKPGEEMQIAGFTLRHSRDQGDRRRPEADGDGAGHGRPPREGAGRDEPGQVVIPQARGGAHHGGGDPARLLGGPLHRACRLRHADPVRDAARRGQPAGELDLGGLRHPGARDVPGAPAGDVLRLCLRARAVGRVDGAMRTGGRG